MNVEKQLLALAFPFGTVPSLKYAAPKKPPFRRFFVLIE